MHSYRDVRYHELRGGVIHTFEVDLDGIPTCEVASTLMFEGDTYLGVARELVSMIASGGGIAPLSCVCSAVFNDWSEVPYHLALYCRHLEFDERMDGWRKCLDCGLEVDLVEEDLSW